MLIEPKEINIDGKTYLLGRVPCIPGRKIFSQYIPTALPKIGNYPENEKLMLELMSYCGIKKDNEVIQFISETLLNNHVDNFETLMKLEKEMINRNTTFFTDGRALTLLKDIVRNFNLKTIQTLTHLLQSSSPKDSQPSQN